MEQWEIDLLDLHLNMWYDAAAVEAIYDSDIPASQVATDMSLRDSAFFLKYYFPHYFSEPWALCHWDLVDEMQTAITNEYPDRLAQSLPRGFGKSTIVCVGFTIWCIVGQDDFGVMGAARKALKEYIILTKDSFDQSKLELASIKEELETNEKLRADWGDFVGAPWGAAEMVTSNGVRIDALGTGQKIRGRRHFAKRPELVILDDLENDKTVRSPTQRLKVKEWVTRAVEKAGDPKTCDFIFIGTHLHYDCTQAWMVDRPGVRSRVYKALLEHATRQDLWDEWRTRLFDLFDENRERTAREFYEERKTEMLEGVSVSWPDRFDYYTLQLMLAGEQTDAQGRRIRSFSAEMQNEPIDEEDRLFKTFHYWHWERERSFSYLVPDDSGHRVNLQTCRLFGACDPSLGETHNGAYTALIDILVAPNNMMFIAHANVERRHPDRVIDYIGMRMRYWLERGKVYSAYGIETVQFQKLFASRTGQDLLQAGLRLPIVEIKSTSNKQARIDSLQPDLQNGYLRLFKAPSEATPQDQQRLYDQLWQYPMGDFVDGPDALEMARTLAAPGGPPSKVKAPQVESAWGEMVVGKDPFSL
jgi:predicted phage terminase large subunit-like protein